MDATAELGGKGANLVRLRDAGFPVPAFVVLPVGEYHAFVADHGLADVIARHLEGEAAAASEAIRAAFRRPMGESQRRRIVSLVGALAESTVAVRSSATAEDLPDASFAGQQDTFLEVEGIEEILAMVVECWSSLWTERAITYRARGHVPEDGLGLAVVVQEQVPAETSGVVFTADPLTGRRDRVVVDAAPGLGEQLVSGRVTPDHWEVEGGRIVESVVQGATPALSEPQVHDLVALCRRIADASGAPQDIEFTWAANEFQIVQARAITSLFPVPDGPKEAIYVSVGAVQGMLAPITPMGRDLLGVIVAGGARVFGRTVDPRANPFVRSAGERLWVRVDRLLSGPARPLLLKILPIGEPVAAAVLTHLADEPAYAPRRDGFSVAAAVPPTVTAVLPRVPVVARNLADPDAARARFTRTADDYVAHLEGEYAAAADHADPRARLAARLQVVDESLSQALALMFSHFLPVMGPSLGMLARLRALAARTGIPDADALAMSIVRSLPDNVTTRMDLALCAAAARIAEDPESREAIRGEPAAVADVYRAGTLPPVATRALQEFLAAYGMRGVAEIDAGVPRWRERPEQVIASLRGYLDGPDHAAGHVEGARAAVAAIERLASASTRVDAAQIRFFGDRLRRLFGLRETPKFTIVRALGLTREAFLATGEDLVAQGRLDRADDVFFLHLHELATAFDRDHRETVSTRRAVRDRESRRTRLPVVLVGDGRAYHSAPGAGDADLTGTGVSPGVVTARVRVVDDPATAGLERGEIMVCRGTDPAWTPLFLVAGGLVTEVGGLMTHGSVVAREYGLPAVVGIPGVTGLLATGDLITLDGSAGTLVRTEPEEVAGPGDVPT